MSYFTHEFIIIFEGRRGGLISKKIDIFLVFIGNNC